MLDILYTALGGKNFKQKSGSKTSWISHLNDQSVFSFWAVLTAVVMKRSIVFLRNVG
jgi:hypothetical protein